VVLVVVLLQIIYLIKIQRKTASAEKHEAQNLERITKRLEILVLAELFASTFVNSKLQNVKRKNTKNLCLTNNRLDYTKITFI